MTGAQAGLRPQEILDLTLWEFDSFIEGYQTHLKDLRGIAVYQGYYSAYYSNVQHPTPVHRMVEEIFSVEEKKPSQGLNIAAFMALEATREELMRNG